MMILALLISACSPQTTATETTPAQPSSGNYPLPSGDVVDAGDPAYPVPGQATLFDPQAGDSELERNEVELALTESSILMLEATPKQAVLELVVLTGNLCDNVRIKVSPPEGTKINVETYAVLDPTLTCVEAQNMVKARVSLGSFVAGSTYEVYVNGQLLGSFDS